MSWIFKYCSCTDLLEVTHIKHTYQFFHHPAPAKKVSWSSNPSISENIVALSIYIFISISTFVQSLKQKSVNWLGMLLIGWHKGVKIHSRLEQDVIKHVKRPSSYDSLRNGWGIEKLKGCWLTGVSLLPHWPARTENWLFCQNARYILFVFLLPYRVWGGAGAGKKKERERGKKGSLTFMVFLLLCSRGIPWSSSQKKEPVTFIWP